jgi:8-oxo-dGTP pyrophosphatase MutT (NUDIX family)
VFQNLRRKEIEFYRLIEMWDIERQRLERTNEARHTSFGFSHLTNMDLPHQLAARLQSPLPGAKAYALLAPELSFGRHAGPAPYNARRAAVLFLLYPQQGNWYVPLTLRPTNLAHHAGQISLPGGTIERGESSRRAAQRELTEELGPVDGIEFLGRLTEYYVWITNFVVTPWVACVSQRPTWQPNPAEVEEVIELPLAHLLDPQHRGELLIERDSYQFTAPCYLWQEHRIWGATSMMLCELATILSELKP